MGVKEKEKERKGVVCGRINSRRRMENRGVVVVSTSTKGGRIMRTRRGVAHGTRLRLQAVEGPVRASVMRGRRMVGRGLSAIKD